MGYAEFVATIHINKSKEKGEPKEAPDMYGMAKKKKLKYDRATDAVSLRGTICSFGRITKLLHDGR